jgi:hypothetical protein
MATDPLEEGMTYVEKLDFREQAFRQKLELEKEQTRRVIAQAKEGKAESRHQVYIYVGISLLVVTLILGVIFFIYKGTRPGPYSNEPGVGERRETACMNQGGTWLPSGLVVGEEGVCVLPGKVPTP